MANTLTSTLRESLEVFYYTLGNESSSFTSWMQGITDSAPIVARADVFGVNGFTEQTDGGAADPTAANLNSSKTTKTRQVWESLVTVSEADLMDNTSLASQITAQMAERAAYKIGELCYAQLAASDTTAHPKASGIYVGSVFCADDFTVDPPDGGSNFAISNLGSSALSAASLSSAINSMRTYREENGLYMNNARDLTLVVPEALRQTALELTGGSEAVWDGAGLQMRFGDEIARTQASNLLTDANDWFLVSRTLSPYKYWIRKSPSVRITPLPSRGAVSFYGSCQASVVIEPGVDYGLFMSKVS